MVEQTVEVLVIRDTIVLNMMSLWWSYYIEYHIINIVVGSNNAERFARNY